MHCSLHSLKLKSYRPKVEDPGKAFQARVCRTPENNANQGNDCQASCSPSVPAMPWGILFYRSKDWSAHSMLNRDDYSLGKTACKSIVYFSRIFTINLMLLIRSRPLRSLHSTALLIIDCLMHPRASHSRQSRTVQLTDPVSIPNLKYSGLPMPTPYSLVMIRHRPSKTTL